MKSLTSLMVEFIELVARAKTRPRVLLVCVKERDRDFWLKMGTESWFSGRKEPSCGFVKGKCVWAREMAIEVDLVWMRNVEDMMIDGIIVQVGESSNTYLYMLSSGYSISTFEKLISS